MRKKIGIAVAIVLVVLCAGVGWLGWNGYNIGRQIVEAGVTQEQFDAQKEGTPESQVRAALPEPLRDVKDEDLYGDDPGKQGMPAGASCVYYTVKPLSEGAEQPMWRFCFVDGALAEKSRITVAE
ncbi:hypothetical protein [Catenuloplanes atrovinosus]|uniref:Uncharacterized protein n=1 Tax=Catenuloplanes atrovinosus TaxID=137266 RepID=A0AAE4C771_9ACTN|nr:hypothetical protein [Catenuloplanes atrovinosus]MDR7274241.1 hypothetical protein [Catenuloplanes atrovinosus]